MTAVPLPRRRLLVALGSLPVAHPMASVAGGPGPQSTPPVARKQPVKDMLWGERIVDPYRWMEDRHDPDWEPFIKGQAAYARRVLDSIPGRKALCERVTQLSAGMAIPRSPQVATKGRLFYEMRPAGANQYRLYMREDLTAPEKLLIDPSTLRGQNDVHVSLDWWVASPDGRFVVYGLSPAGSENSVAHILEVDTMTVLPERIDGAPWASPSWLPDSSGFFFNRLAEGRPLGAQDSYLDSVAWLHRLGTDPKSDVRVMSRGQFPGVSIERIDSPRVAADPTSRYVVGIVRGGVRRQNPLYVATLESALGGQPQWRKVCDVVDEVTAFAFRDDELYLLTTRDATNGKVLKTSLLAPDIARASTVVPEGQAVLESIFIARDGLYLKDMEGGYNALRRLGNDGRIEAIKLPFEGSFESMTSDAREGGVWIVGTSWLLPFTAFRHEPSTGKTVAVPLAPPTPLDLGRFEAIRSYALARDGTKVPLSIVAPKGLKRSGRNPVLIEAYGAYGISITPHFNSRGVAFLENGGVLAYAHVRGGGEYGRRWWIAGQKLSKPNTWRDLIDCCEELVRQKWTSPRHLTIQGFSAGGIAVGRALTERPDLFAAVIFNVGVSNALRKEFTPNGPANIEEYGTVTERAGFLGLKQMDSLHAVHDGVRYPAVLLTTGMTDPRVEPWQVAKFAARLQDAAAHLAPGDRNPVLLRVDFDAGHGVGSTRQQWDAQNTDEFAFALWRSGVRGFQPVAAG